MSRWRLETSAAFDRSIRRLPPATAHRIRHYLEDICNLDNPRSRGRPLHGKFAGYWRYRVGDYRIVAHVATDCMTVIAIKLGHRSAIYR